MVLSPSPPDAPTGRPASHPKRILLVIVLAHAGLAFDGFALNVALPVIQQDLGMTPTQRQWVISGGALAVGALLPLAGRVVDRIGPRTGLIAAAVAFVLPLLVIVVADSGWQVIAARTVQGAAAALLIPATYSMTIAAFPGRRGRSLAIGVLALAGALSAAFGSLIAGVLVDRASWRFSFVIVLVMMLVVLAGSVFMLNRTPGHSHTSIDVAGTVTVTLGLLGLVFGLSQAGQTGWADPLVIGSLAAGLALCAGFLVAQHRSPRPFLPLVVFRDRDRAGAMIAMAAAGFGSVGTTFFLTLHMTVTMGLSSSTVGMTYFVQTVTQAVVTTVVITRLGHLVGARQLVTLGLLLWGGAAAWIAWGGDTADSWATVLVPAVVIIGIGSGFLYSTVANIAIIRLDHDLVGVASAVASALPQIGAALGAAVLGSLSVQSDGVSNFSTPIGAGAAVFVVGAVIALFLLRSGPLHDQPPARQRVLPRIIGPGWVSILSGRGSSDKGSVN